MTTIVLGMKNSFIALRNMSFLKKFNMATFLLMSCMFASGGCGLVLEYIQASVATQILGNAFEQYGIVIGLMMFMMGVAAWVQRFINEKRVIETFVLIEICLALIGGFAPIATCWAHAMMENHFMLIHYFFIMSIGFLIGLEIPVIMMVNQKFAMKLKINISQVFSADYFGSLAGAFLWVFYLLRKFPLTEISFILAIVNFSIAVVTYAFFSYKKLISARFITIVILFLTTVSLIGGLRYNRTWDVKLEQHLYEEQIVLSKSSVYQHFVITYNKYLDEYSFFINGRTQWNSGDENRYHEPLVHPVMNIAPYHRTVLILGGGDGMALREVLKYDHVKKVLLVDLDPDMTHLCANDPVLRELNGHAFDDARVRTKDADGIFSSGFRTLYMETGAQEKDETTVVEPVASVQILNIDADLFLSQVKDKWDIVIVDFPDPSGIELVKLYTKEFYLKVRRILSDGGMMVVQSTSPYHAKESYLGIGRTIEAAKFSTIPFHVNVPSFGDWGWFMAWKKDTMSKGYVMRKIESLEFNVETTFITPDVFRSSMVFGKGLLTSKHTDINTLMNPVVLNYYLNESWQVE
jgi:spermidine synthase